MLINGIELLKNNKDLDTPKSLLFLLSIFLLQTHYSQIRPKIMRTVNLISPLLILFGITLSCSNGAKAPQEGNKDAAENQAFDDLLSSEEGWESLFNGENFEGWELVIPQEKDQSRNLWSIQDGAILANSMGFSDHYYSWCQTKKEYADFVLKLKYQTYRDSPRNSGIQIRSRFDSSGTYQG